LDPIPNPQSPIPMILFFKILKNIIKRKNKFEKINKIIKK